MEVGGKVWRIFLSSFRASMGYGPSVHGLWESIFSKIVLVSMKDVWFLLSKMVHLLGTLRFSKSVWGLVAFFSLSTSPYVWAESSESSFLIRDAEIEETLKSYLRPLFRVAGLEGQNIHIHLVADKQMNAMATSGYQMILFTGFLLRAENVGQVIGVLAHETGHIADGHVVHVFGEMKRMGTMSIAHLLLGAAAALAGSPEAGMAIGLGGAGMAQGNFLHYHRGQEASADQNALRYLKNLGWPIKGLGEFLEILKRQEYFSSTHQDPYLRTHPLTQERVDAVKSHLALALPKDSKGFPADFQEKFVRMQAKLRGHLFPTQALLDYPESDQSVAARYARSFAYYRQNDFGRAMNLVGSLLEEEPKNPFFWELKAQIFFEQGQTKESLSCYAKAFEFLPHSSLLRVQYAQTLIEMDSPFRTAQAEKLLNQALKEEKENPLLWRLFAILYGRKKEEGKMALALAEEAFLKGDKKNTAYQVERALKKLPKHSPLWIRAQDLEMELKNTES